MNLEECKIKYRCDYITNYDNGFRQTKFTFKSGEIKDFYLTPEDSNTSFEKLINRHLRNEKLNRLMKG